MVCARNLIPTTNDIQGITDRITENVTGWQLQRILCNIYYLQYAKLLIIMKGNRIKQQEMLIERENKLRRIVGRD